MEEDCCIAENELFGKHFAGILDLLSQDNTIDPFPSARNNNWFLLTIGCRRGITFLEHQPEIDSERIGVFGHSMGGRLTGPVAGTDDRVKAACPSVGGSGFLTPKTVGQISGFGN